MYSFYVNKQTTQNLLSGSHISISVSIMAEYDPQPYNINVPDSALEDLKTRLSLTKLPSQFSAGSEGDDWDLGAPVPEVKKLVEYWKDEFDWRKAEEKMNQLPNYRTGIEVEGFGVLDIHCLSLSLRNILSLLERC